MKESNSLYALLNHLYVHSVMWWKFCSYHYIAPKQFSENLCPDNFESPPTVYTGFVALYMFIHQRKSLMFIQ